MKKNVYIAGHNGMVGSALVRAFKNRADVNLITRTRQELDLSNQGQVQEFFNSQAIDEVYLAAAKVGGILANQCYPADFIYQNLMITANVVNAAHNADINKLLFLGSSCIYPRNADQPIKESQLLTGALEETNKPYALAKIAGITLCESYSRQYQRDYRSVMPTNLYGPGDNFHPNNSHVIPALIRKFHTAVQQGIDTVTVWGSGSPLREFLHVDDLANACLYIMELEKSTLLQVTPKNTSHINVGSGLELSIKALVHMVSEIAGYQGSITWDRSKPDGTPRKLLDISLIKKLGWSPDIPLKEGLSETYDWFARHQSNFREN